MLSLKLVGTILTVCDEALSGFDFFLSFRVFVLGQQRAGKNCIG
jgi:hypothetical protein